MMEQVLVVLGVWISRKVYPDDEESFTALRDEIQGMKSRVDSFKERIETEAAGENQENEEQKVTLQDLIIASKENDSIVPIQTKWVHLAKMMSKIEEGEHAIKDLEEELLQCDDSSRSSIEAEIAQIRKINALIQKSLTQHLQDIGDPEKLQADHK